MSPKKRSIALLARGEGLAALLVALEEKELSDGESEDDAEPAVEGLGDGIVTRKVFFAGDRFKADFLGTGGDDGGVFRMSRIILMLKRSRWSSRSNASR